MSGYIVMVFKDGLRLSHKTAYVWGEVKRLRGTAMRTPNVRRVVVQKWRDCDGDRQIVSGPHEVYRANKYA